MSNPAVMELVRGGGHHGRPHTCPEELFNYLLNCFHPNAKSRPTFVTLWRDVDAMWQDASASSTGANDGRAVGRSTSLRPTSISAKYAESRQTLAELSGPSLVSLISQQSRPMGCGCGEVNDNGLNATHAKMNGLQQAQHRAARAANTACQKAPGFQTKAATSNTYHQECECR